MFRNVAKRLYSRLVAPTIHSWFFRDLIRKTDNFGSITWLGHPIWQNVLDLWVIQETVAEIRPELLIESGTNRGGSSLFYAHLFDLMSHGRVITIDIEKMHRHSHPRVKYLIGSSTSQEILDTVHHEARVANGPIMVILDSDHSEQHVRRELEKYSELVTPGSFCLVQDGSIDTVARWRSLRPGPLGAIDAFLATNADFELDEDRSSRFLISHHPKGWLKRKPDGHSLSVQPQAS